MWRRILLSCAAVVVLGFHATVGYMQPGAAEANRERIDSLRRDLTEHELEIQETLVTIESRIGLIERFLSELLWLGRGVVLALVIYGVRDLWISRAIAQVRE